MAIVLTKEMVLGDLYRFSTFIQSDYEVDRCEVYQEEGEGRLLYLGYRVFDGTDEIIIRRPYPTVNGDLEVRQDEPWHVVFNGDFDTTPFKILGDVFEKYGINKKR